MIAGKGSTLVILNKGMNDTIRIIKSPENSCVLTHGVNETEKKKKKKERKRKKKSRNWITWYFIGDLGSISCSIQYGGIGKFLPRDIF